MLLAPVPARRGTTLITAYLVSTYFSAAPLVPDALGVLENVELGR